MEDEPEDGAPNEDNHDKQDNESKEANGGGRPEGGGVIDAVEIGRGEEGLEEVVDFGGGGVFGELAHHAINVGLAVPGPAVLNGLGLTNFGGLSINIDLTGG